MLAEGASANFFFGGSWESEKGCGEMPFSLTAKRNFGILYKNCCAMQGAMLFKNADMPIAFIWLPIW